MIRKSVSESNILITSACGQSTRAEIYFSPKETLVEASWASAFGQQRSFAGWCMNDFEVPFAADRYQIVIGSLRPKLVANDQILEGMLVPKLDTHLIRNLMRITMANPHL